MDSRGCGKFDWGVPPPPPPPLSHTHTHPLSHTQVGNYFPDDFKYMNVPVSDDGGEELFATLDHCIDFIRACGWSCSLAPPVIDNLTPSSRLARPM
jgi:hypothetical protein